MTNRPELQTILLKRLQHEFNVDVSEANDLLGDKLDLFLSDAEDKLFADLFAQFKAQRELTKT